jgi:Undecaprenyl-phosphate glucose phosphotransferase
MIKRSPSATVFVIDLVILFASFIGVFIYYNGWSFLPFKGAILLSYIAIAWFLIASNSSITSINIQSKILYVMKDTLIGYSVLSSSMIAAVAIFGEFAPNNKLILWPLCFSAVLSCAFRGLYLLTVKHFIKNGYQQKSLLLVGGDGVAERVVNEIVPRRELGYKLHGVIADDYQESIPRGMYLGKLNRFCEIVQSGLVDEVLIALPLKEEKTILELVEKCEHEGIRARVVPDFFKVIRNRPELGSIGDIPVLSIRTEPLDLLRNRALKRAFDIGFSLTALLLLSPAFLVLAVLIKLTSPGTVFFKQKRVGANNVDFEIYKFRSMKVQEKTKSDTIWTTEDDPRVTWIGKFMRKNNLDELPQFWNVLSGDMSIVGPRPEREYFVEKFKEDISNYKVRHLVKSGITGWAQVNGWRGDTSIEKRVEHDIYYLENWSFWLDLKIIWRTIFSRQTQQHAY